MQRLVSFRLHDARARLVSSTLPYSGGNAVSLCIAHFISLWRYLRARACSLLTEAFIRALPVSGVTGSAGQGGAGPAAADASYNLADIKVPVTLVYANNDLISGPQVGYRVDCAGP